MAQSPSDKAIDATEDLHSSDERARKRIKHAQDDTRVPTGSTLGPTVATATSQEVGLATAEEVSHDAKNASPAPSLPAPDHATPSIFKQAERRHTGASQATRTTEAVRGCGHEVQIEDLAHLHCGRIEGAKAKANKSSHKRRRPKLLLPVQQLLPCTSQAPTTPSASIRLLQAPIVPSQSELQFPLSAVVVSHALREQRRRKKTERAAHLAAETEPAAVKVALTWPDDVADVGDKSSHGKRVGRGKGKGPVTHAGEWQRDQSQHESQHKRNKQAAGAAAALVRTSTSRALLPSPLSQSISNNPSLLTDPVRRTKRGTAPPRHRQTPEGPAPSCLLESRNPSYFQQPRFAQWHLPADNPQALGPLASSSDPLHQQQQQHQQQVYNNPDMMWIDPETAIDYTAVFARPEPLHLQRSATSGLGNTDLSLVAQDNDKYMPAMDTPMTEASWFTAPAESHSMGYDLSGDEAGASSPDEDAASSLQSSPDALAQPLDYTFAEAPALRGPGFELDTLFDWDQADASLFADTPSGEVPLSALAFERALASQFSYSHEDAHVSMPASLSAASLQATAAQQQWRQRREQADGPPPPTFSPAESTLTFSREGSAELQETAVFEMPAALHTDGDVAHAPTSTTGPATACIKSPKIKKQRSIHGSDDEPLTQCHNCGVTKTPLWRRTPCKRHSLCNACGLYLKQYNHDRPLNRASRQPPTKIEEGVAPTVCANCAGTQTSLWRKDESGAAVCNACGLYSKLHGKARPVGMRKEKVARRKRFRNLPPSPPAQSMTALPMATAMMASIESMDFSAVQLATGAAPQAEVPVAAVAAAAATDLVAGSSESPHSAASVLSTPVAA